MLRLVILTIAATLCSSQEPGDITCDDCRIPDGEYPEEGYSKPLYIISLLFTSPLQTNGLFQNKKSKQDNERKGMEMQTCNKMCTVGFLLHVSKAPRIR